VYFVLPGGPKGPDEGKADKLQKKRSETDKMQDLCTKSNIIDGIYSKNLVFYAFTGAKAGGATAGVATKQGRLACTKGGTKRFLGRLHKRAAAIQGNTEWGINP
jgi:hypothetical protein